MKLTTGDYGIFRETLILSEMHNKELGSFGLYIPGKDAVVKVVPPTELYRGSIVGRTKGGLVFSDDVAQKIKDFNEDRVSSITLGPNYTFKNENGAKVFGFHTHPHTGVGDYMCIVPSPQDADEIVKRSSPLEVILSRAGSNWTDMLTVVGYDPKFFPAGDVDFAELFGYKDLITVQKLAEEMGIPWDAMSELLYLNHRTGLKASLDIELTRNAIK